MSNRPRILLAAVLGAFGLGVLGSSERALADHISVGAQAGVLGKGLTTLHTRFEWGAHHGFRMALQTELRDQDFHTLDVVPGEGHYARSSARGTMYALTYEYSLNGRHAPRTWFFGAGPSYIKGSTSAAENHSYFSQSEGHWVDYQSNPAYGSFDTLGLVTYAGCRAAIHSSLRLTATLEGLWTSENISWLAPRQYFFDFDGVSLQLGCDLSF